MIRGRYEIRIAGRLEISIKYDLLLNRVVGRHGKIMEIYLFSQIISHDEFSAFVKSLLGLVQEISMNYSQIIHCAAGCCKYWGDWTCIIKHKIPGLINFVDSRANISYHICKKVWEFFPHVISPFSILAFVVPFLHMFRWKHRATATCPH